MLPESEIELDPDSDLSWLALRYVAGEMGPDEAEAFECRLDHDQSAREAVAEAVALAGAIARLEPASASMSGPVLPMRRRVSVATVAGIVGAAAAACLAWLMVDWRGHGTDGQPPAIVQRPGVSAKAPTESVLLAWSKLRQEDVAEESHPRNDVLAWNDEAPALPDSESTSADETEDTSDHGLPGWLLDAASLAGRSDSGPEPGL